MNNRLHLIYIPGLGDSKVTGQRILISTWTFWGVEAELFQMNWDNKESWASKKERLLNRIDTLIAEGKRICLVGASAGTSAVINIFALRKDKIIGCVLIAAKINRPETIGQNYRDRSQSFFDSVENCKKSLGTLSINNRSRILSRYALSDGVVIAADSKVDGGHNQVVLSLYHPLLITNQILFGVPSFIRFLKSLDNKNNKI